MHWLTVNESYSGSRDETKRQALRSAGTCSRLLMPTICLSIIGGENVILVAGHFMPVYQTLLIREPHLTQLYCLAIFKLNFKYFT